MPLIDLTVKHGTTLDDAKKQLAAAVADVQRQFATLIHSVVWNAEQTAVKLTGPGAVVELRVDPENVRATGDIPFLGALLGSGIGQRLSQGLKGVLTRHFPKGIPHHKA